MTRWNSSETKHQRWTEVSSGLAGLSTSPILFWYSARLKSEVASPAARVIGSLAAGPSADTVTWRVPVK